MSLAGLDMGTTGCKAVVFSEDGKILASAAREYPLVQPRPGWAELDSNAVWQKAEEVLREVGAETASDPIRAMAVSSQGEAVTPVDEKGRFLWNAPVSFDARTADLVRWWEEEIGVESTFRITGQRVNSMYTALKVKWLKDAHPEVYARTRRFLFFSDLVCHQLGVAPLTDYSMAGTSLLFDILRKEWSGEIFEKAGLHRDKFSPVAPSGTIIGTVPDGIADRLGLPRGLKIVTGGHDQPVAALGSGVVRPGLANYGMGAVDCITVAFSEPVMTPEMMESHIRCYDHARPGLYTSMVFNFSGGALFRWYRDTFGESERIEAKRAGRDVYEILCEKAMARPSDLFVLPHFTTTGTPYFDNHSRGAILGLRLSTEKSEITRAFLEGIAMELKLSVDVLEKSGVAIERFHATGGGSRSDLWCRIKADILNRPISAMDVSESGCLGCAILAGVATGVYASFEEASSLVTHFRKTFEPDRENVKIYEEKMEVYREIYPKLKDLHQRMR